MIVVTREEINNATECTDHRDVAGVLLDVACSLKLLIKEKRVDKLRLYELLSSGLQFDKNTSASRLFLDALREEGLDDREPVTFKANRFE